MDFTSPDVQYTYDLRNNRMFAKDSGNVIYALGVQQLNTLGNVSLLDIYLTKGNVVEPHIHQNASELVYAIEGAAVVSMINPFIGQVLQFPIGPGQVANVPQGWIHWEVATEENTHLLAIFDAPVPEFIGMSDFLRLAPRNILAHTYCLDQTAITEALAPITATTVIGPPADCAQNHQPAPAPQPEAMIHAQQAGQQQAQAARSPYGPYYGQPYYGRTPVQGYGQAYGYGQGYPAPYGQPYAYPGQQGYWGG
jgi:oxalate decarboxylase/phosphoglucose isomerase-like protein (cupin superfamily)